MLNKQDLRPHFINFVVTYLENRNWLLEAPEKFAEEMWNDTETGKLVVADYKALRVIIFRRYSAVVWAMCQDEENAGTYDQSWQALREFLSKKARQRMPNFNDWEDAVQESLITTHRYLQLNRIKKPEQFLNLITTLLYNGMVDKTRHQDAKKRGGNKVTSLEELLENNQEQDYQGFRNTEQQALFAVAEQNLAKKFEEVLNTCNQKSVAKMYFIQQLKPREIAQIMGKAPHEIRQTVLRVRKRMKKFLPEATKWLPPPI